MRIAVFSDTFFPQINGVSRVLGKYLEYMDKKDIEYSLFVPDKQENVYNGNIISLGGVKFVLYPEMKIVLTRYLKVKHVLDEFKPDLVHLATPLSMGLMGMKYARANQLPLISSYHTNFDQYLNYYHLPLLVGPVNKYVKWFHSFSQLNFCPSRETLLRLQELGISNLEVCPNGVDQEFFSPNFRNAHTRQSLFTDTEGPILLYVGRIAPEKGLNVLIKAVQTHNHWGSSFKLILVGDGPSREKLESMGIDNVLFLGYKSGRELQEVYASADLFVFPSSTETFGNVILEAMCSGLPVVAARAGGVKDNVIDMYNGMTFQPGDHLDMARAINMLLLDKTLRSQLASNAVEYAMTKTWDEIFDQFFSRLQNLLPKSEDGKSNVA